MMIVELISPGDRLDTHDDDWSGNVEDLLDRLQSQLIDVNICVNLFEQAEHYQKRQFQLADEWREKEWEQRAQATWPPTFEDEIESKRQKWHQGILPYEYVHNLKFVHATAFVSALNLFGVYLKQIASYPKVPTQVVKQTEHFWQHFSNLTEIRNSIQHINERVQGKARKKQIDLKAISDHDAIQVGPGNIVVGNLSGNKYGIQVKSGEYAEIEVSDTSLRIAQDCLQSILNSFKWIGPKQHWPS